MSGWADVINYVRLRYEVLQEQDGWIRFRLGTDGSRTQQATVHLLPDPGDTVRAEISSAVGRADEIDLRRLLELVGESEVGGAAIVDGVALLRHVVPLGDLDIRHEFQGPLEALVHRADQLERRLTSQDEF